MMNRPPLQSEVFSYIKEAYGVEPDYPWLRYPEFAVFRHQNNRKWFALVMRMERNRLGLSGTEPVGILNLKLEDALAVDFLVTQPGFLPAYHMSKGHWISVLLDGTVALAQITPLIDQSFAVTAAKVRIKKSNCDEASQ